MATSNAATSLLSDCNAEIPVGDVTRVFDFGQFIELYDPGTGPNPVPTPIVVDPVGNMKISSFVTMARRIGGKPVSTVDQSNQEISRIGGRSLQALLTTGQNETEAAIVEIDELQAALNSSELVVDDVSYIFSPTSAEREVLIAGAEIITSLARKENGPSRSIRARLLCNEIHLTPEEATTAIAKREINLDGTPAQIRLDAEAIRALLAEQAVETVLLDSSGGVRRRIRLSPCIGDPAPGVREIEDLPTFLEGPTAPDANGRPAQISLSADEIMALHKDGEVTRQLPNGKLRLVVKRSGMQLRKMMREREGEYGDAGDKEPGTGGAGSDGSDNTGDDTSGASNSNTGTIAGTVYVVPPPFVTVTYTPPPLPADRDASDLVEPRLPGGRGIPVAVLVPWRQTWKLTGFSRGALLTSLALTPQEEVLIEMRTWERRTRSLDQSSETDTEQSFESVDTRKDTEETFDELTSKQDFTWQVGGSLDVSYSPGVASINVSATANVENAQNVSNVARTTAQRTQEATMRAAAKVRSRRVTRISETIETGTENRVTRRIRNSNLTRTLTFDFFETLAHYEVSLEFVPGRLSLVALIENPEHRNAADFTETLVRQNESTFRNALLEPALVDGFSALKLLAAYEAAKAIVMEQEAAQKAAETIRNTSTPASTQPTTTPDPAQAQADAVIDTMKQMHAAAQTLRKRANVDTALYQIRTQSEDGARPVNEDERRNAQYWLFVQCLAARVPALLDALIALAGRDPAKLEVADAQHLATVIPGPTAPKSLASITEMTSSEKEDAGLSSAIKRYMRMAWDWGWWTQRCREESLYTPNDAGVIGLADKLFQSLQAWEAKRTEGAFAKDKDVALKEAEGKQEEAATEDRLAMAFPLDEHARAIERANALIGHISQHANHYSYALFQALTPSEQVARILQASGGQLQVGLFEPRIVAMHGSKLAVPLTPLAASGLQPFVSTLKTALTAALADTAAKPDQVVLPTPGVNVTSRLGACTAAEEFIEESRLNDIELGRARVRQATAEAESAEAEASRRAALLKKEQLDPFTSEG